jgi:hypothetical protein
LGQLLELRLSNLHIQASFNSGEWAPTLFARVDLAKYRSGAELLENFFVDYRGGASTRTGTKYILQAYKSATAVRLIPFQASFNVGYVLEFGDGYIRPIFLGAPVLETALNITTATNANPCVINVPGNAYLVGEWIFITGVGGMTQLNGRYFQISNVAGASITLADLNGVPIDSTGYGVYTSGGTASRVFTIPSPYAAADLRLIKFAQNVNELILCHPNYQPYVLTLITATNWTLLPITFGSTAIAPTITLNTNLPGGSVNYSYLATAIDSNGQESVPSSPVSLIGYQDLRTTPGTIRVTVNTTPGSVAYNIYKADVSYLGAIPLGATYGYIGTTTSSEFVDSNIAPDFTQTPPINKNPFVGKGIASVAVTAPGVYTAVPGVNFTGAPSTIAASATAILQVQGTPTVGVGGTGYAIGDTVTFTNDVILIVASVSGGAVTAWQPITTPGASSGSVTAGPTPSNPVVQLTTSGGGTGATANLVWGVGLVQVLAPGAGYTSTPTVTFSSGAATATATLSATSNGYPSLPGFFQQRLVLAAPTGAPQTFYMSKPGQYFNFDVSSISQADDSITGTLVSGQLNTIKSMVSQTSGLLMFTDRNSWLINGGSNGSAVSPSALVANAQSFVGTNDVPPIISNFDVLYVQSKGSAIRDSAYNIYANVFTGTDISVLSSHLFYGYEILEWAWAEEPFKLVYAIRNDGTLLNLTFLKEQEFIGWAHSITQGQFSSIAAVTELTTTAGEVDAVYAVVDRMVNGFNVKYIERFAERTFPNGVEDAWTVDAALNYVGAPKSTFSGAEHLAGLTVTGLADGQPITPFVMPISGEFTLPVAASKVVVGLSYIPKLKTLGIDIGDPTIQGKLKKIPDVTVRVAQTLGLEIGSDFDHLVPMQDLIRGNVSKMLSGLENQIITNLVDGNANTILDPTYNIPGQYCIQQSLPYPATILGVIPNLEVGDGDGRPR